MAWLTGWNRRKSHLITASAGAGTNYQTIIKVYKTTGTDGTESVNGITAGKVYVGSNCRDDFGDIRFTDNDGNTLLDYWMVTESLVSGTSAVFWVEVADTLESNATIYVYYDKSGETDASNGANTFLFFDHFIGSSLDTSIWNNTTTVAVGSSIATIGNASAAWKGLLSKATFGVGNIRCCWRSKQTVHSMNGMAFQNNPNIPYKSIIMFYATSSTMYQAQKTGGAEQGAITFVINAYHNFEVRWTTTNAIYVYDGATLKNTTTNVADAAISCGANQYQGYSYLDYIFVAKYLATEPAHSTWGSEELSGPTTYTLTYSIDTLLQKLGLTASYSIDAKIAELDITKPYSIDLLLKKLGIEESYNVDVLVKKLGITETYSIDAIFEKLGVEKPYTVDVLFKLFGITKTYNIDVLIRLIAGIEETYDIDTILKKLGVTKSYSIDATFKKLGVDETYGIDVLIKKLGLEESYVIDTLLKKLGITKTYSVDTMLSVLPEKLYSIDVIIVPYFGLQTYSVDVRIISVEKTKGRMNIVKSKLMALVKMADSTITTIDEADLKTWDINFPMASVKLNPSSESKMSYGNKLPDGTRGQYFVYNFSIHVFTEPNTTDQLKAKDVMELAETIKKYLRRNNKDSASGILDIYDITYRESDPEPHGTRKMTRAIMAGKILVERPWGTGFDN